MITSAGSIDADGTLLEYDLNESAMAQTAMRAARNVFVALDSTKYVPKGSVELGNISAATRLFTDKHPPADLTSILELHGVKLEICS